MIIAAGATQAIMPKDHVGIFSFVTKGKLISGLVRENGRLFGVNLAKTAPTAAVAMIMTQSKT